MEFQKYWEKFYSLNVVNKPVLGCRIFKYNSVRPVFLNYLLNKTNTIQPLSSEEIVKQFQFGSNAIKLFVIIQHGVNNFFFRLCLVSAFLSLGSAAPNVVTNLVPMCGVQIQLCPNGIFTLAVNIKCMKLVGQSNLFLKIVGNFKNLCLIY